MIFKKPLNEKHVNTLRALNIEKDPLAEAILADADTSGILPDSDKTYEDHEHKASKSVDSLFDLFKTTLDAHVGTKTNDSTFHDKSKGFYELLFECYHAVKEREQDLEACKPTDPEVAAAAAYDSLEEAKEIVGDLIKRDNSFGMDNLLRGLYDKLENACGDARAFIK